jgi:hypothetical protein
MHKEQEQAMNDKLLFNNLNDKNCLNCVQVKRLNELGLNPVRNSDMSWTLEKLHIKSGNFIKNKFHAIVTKTCKKILTSKETK